MALEKLCSKHFGDTRIVLAGHNIKFDIAFLKKLYQTYDINFDKLIEHYQIPIQGRHMALGDALATAYLFNSLLET